MAGKITSIHGLEPRREGEYPSGATVGYQWKTDFTVTRIERREEFLGTYSLIWFDVFAADTLLFSMQGSAVAEVHYEIVAA